MRRTRPSGPSGSNGPSRTSAAVALLLAAGLATGTARAQSDPSQFGTIFNIGAAFWGLVAGMLTSLILEWSDFKGERAAATADRQPEDG